MTIDATAAREAELSASGESNNPFIACSPLSGTWSTDIGTEVLAAANAGNTTSTYDKWEATENGSNRAALAVDFGSTQSPGFVGVAAHNLGTQTSEVFLQRSSDGSSWSTVAQSISPTDNRAFGWRLDSGLSDRYWRFRCDDLPTGEAAQIGVAFFGTEIILPQRIYQGYTPPLTPTNVQSAANVSEGAQLLGSYYINRGSSIQATIDHLTPSFVRGATWQTFQQEWNEGCPAFWAWRPTKYGDLHFMWRGGAQAIVPTNSGPKDYMSLTIAGRAYDDP